MEVSNEESKYKWRMEDGRWKAMGLEDHRIK